MPLQPKHLTDAVQFIRQNIHNALTDDKTDLSTFLPECVAITKGDITPSSEWLGFMRHYISADSILANPALNGLDHHEEVVAISCLAKLIMLHTLQKDALHALQQEGTDTAPWTQYQTEMSDPLNQQFDTLKTAMTSSIPINCKAFMFVELYRLFKEDDLRRPLITTLPNHIIPKSIERDEELETLLNCLPTLKDIKSETAYKNLAAAALAFLDRQKSTKYNDYDAYAHSFNTSLTLFTTLPRAALSTDSIHAIKQHHHALIQQFRHGPSISIPETFKLGLDFAKFSFAISGILTTLILVALHIYLIVTHSRRTQPLINMSLPAFMALSLGSFFLTGLAGFTSITYFMGLRNHANHVREESTSLPDWMREQTYTGNCYLGSGVASTSMARAPESGGEEENEATSLRRRATHQSPQTPPRA